MAEPFDLGADVPWGLLAPFAQGSPLGHGWILEAMTPVSAGAVEILLRSASRGIARVTVRRNGGKAVGIAHTEQLDFMLMNGGGGAAQTEDSIEQALMRMAETLRRNRRGGPDPSLLAALTPHVEPDRSSGRQTERAPDPAAERITPVIDLDAATIAFDLDERRFARPALKEAMLPFAERCDAAVAGQDNHRVAMTLTAKGDKSKHALAALAREVTRSLKQIGWPETVARIRASGLARLPRAGLDVEALLAELEAADPATLGRGFRSERGPAHENLRILNIRGTGACDSECVFCIEKFVPTHRSMPTTDATRQLILDSAGQYDMLFFASGEPTIHPRLFEHVELAKSVGFSCFGMSSHFRTFADPRFALKTLQAGFEFFDIALHAADAASQLAVNPIGDGGKSLFEALKGLGIINRLAETLGLRVSITHKIVISKLNLTQLEPIFWQTYERGVRHFILQPVRALGVTPELEQMLTVTEEEVLPYLNELLRKTAGTGAVVKPYGFSRQNLVAGDHVESEQNRVKNIYGKARRANEASSQPGIREQRPDDGRHWVEVRQPSAAATSFATTGEAPVLDDALKRGADLPFGCRMGSCGMCCARLLEGKVDQSSQIFLTEAQVQQNYVLMCQAHPLSDVVLEVCSDDEIDAL